MAEFPALLKSCGPDTALLYGVCKNPGAGRIVAEKFRDPADPYSASRTKTYFQHQTGPAILVLDIDTAIDREKLVNVLCEVFPQFKMTALVWAASASACIFDKETGQELRGLTGQRVYLAIANGTDIPRVIRILHVKLWIAGHGHIEISQAGSMLECSLIDRAMAVPTQPDFCGGAKCGNGLEQKRPKPALLGDGPPLDTCCAIENRADDEERQHKAIVDLKKYSAIQRPKQKGKNGSRVAS